MDQTQIDDLYKEYGFMLPMSAKKGDPAVGMMEDGSLIFRASDGTKYSMPVPDRQPKRSVSEVMEDPSGAVKRVAKSAVDEAVAAVTAPARALKGEQVTLGDAVGTAGAAMTGGLSASVARGGLKFDPDTVPLFGGQFARSISDGKSERYFRNQEAQRLLVDNKEMVSLEDIERRTGMVLNTKTGKFQFAIDIDGFEFDTDVLKSYKEVLGQKRRVFNSDKVRVSGHLTDFYKVDSLIEEYPRFADTTVVFKDFDDPSDFGEFNVERNEIILRASLLEDTDLLKATLHHELQHGIQDLEGDVSGANPQWYLYNDPEIKRVLSKADALSKKDKYGPKGDKLYNEAMRLAFEKYSANSGEVEARAASNWALESPETRKSTSFRGWIDREMSTKDGVDLSKVRHADRFPYRGSPRKYADGGLVGEPEMVNTMDKQQEQTTEEKKLGILKELAPFFQDALDPSGKLAKEKEKEKEAEAKPVATSAPVSGGQLNAAPTKQLEQVRSAAAQQPLLLSTLKEDIGMYAAGGLATRGGTDPVSGNPVPVGSTPEEVRDDIPAKVSEGEYVVPADVVRYFGVKFFEDLRREAKSEFSGMESEGRIGGMNPMDDDVDPEDPYELAAKINAEGDEPIKMFLGGLFGKKETPTTGGGTTTQEDIDKVTTGAPFVGNDWSVVGGSVFGQTGGITYATYTNGSETISIPFFRGRNLRPIPHGFRPVGSGNGSGSGGKKDAHPDPRDATYTHGGVLPRSITGSPSASQKAPSVNLYAMSEEELMNWAKGGDGLLSKGLVGQLMTISRVRAAAKVAADRGFDINPYIALEQEQENNLGIGADLLDEMVASGEMRYNQQQVYNPNSEQYVDPKTGQRPNAQSGAGGGQSAGGGASAETPVESIPLGNDVEGGKLPAQYDKNGNLMKEVGLRDPAKFTGWSEDTPGTWDDKPAKYVHPDALKIIGEAAQATWGDDLARIIVASGADEHSRNHGKGVPYAAVADVVFVLNDGTVVSEKDPKYLTFAEQAAARGASQIAWGPEYMTNAIHVGINTPGYGDEKTIRGNWASSSAEQADHLQNILNAYHARGPENEFVIPVNYERNIPIAVKTQAELIAEADGVERKRQRLVQEEADAVNRGDGAAAAAAVRAREELEAIQGIARKSQYEDLPLGMGGEKVITDIEAMPKMAQASGGFSISGDPGMVGRQGFGSPDPELLALAVQEARANGIPERLFVAQIAKESSWNPNTTSEAGATGLNQFMPATAATYGIDPTDPKQSIPAAAKYMKASYDRWGSWDLALAAYNAGDGAVQKYGGKIPPYTETQNYVNAVNEWANRATWAIEEQAPQPQQTGQQVTGFVGPQGGVPLVTVGDTGLVMQRQTTNSLFNDALKNPNDLFTRAGAGGFDIAHGLGVASVNEDGTASYYEGTAQSPRDPGDHGTSWQGDNSEGLRPVSPVPVYNAEGKLISTELAPDRHVLHDYLRDEAGNVITGWDAARTMHFLDTTGLGLMSSEEMARLEPKANKFPMTIPEGGIYGKTGNPTADVNNGFGKFGLLNPLIVIKEQLGIKPVPATATPIYGDTGVAQAMTDAPWMELQTADSGMGEVFSAKDESKVDVDRTDPLSRALAGETGVSGAGTGFMTKPYAGSTSKDSSPTADQIGVAYTPMSGPISDPVGAAKASPNAVTGSIGGTKVTYTAPPQELKSYTEAEDDLNKDKGFTFGGTSYRKGGLVAKRKPKKSKK